MKEHLNRTECCLTIVKAINEMETREKSKNTLRVSNYRDKRGMRRKVVMVMNEGDGGCGGGKDRCVCGCRWIYKYTDINNSITHGTYEEQKIQCITIQQV